MVRSPGQPNREERSSWLPSMLGVPQRGVQLAARNADPRTTTIYDRRRDNFDRHAAYVVVECIAGA
jgi:integrase/recombinase XerD